MVIEKVGIYYRCKWKVEKGISFFGNPIIGIEVKSYKRKCDIIKLINKLDLGVINYLGEELSKEICILKILEGQNV